MEYSGRNQAPKSDDVEVRTIRALHPCKGWKSIRKRRGLRVFYWYVITCCGESCSFETPLCETELRARELFAEHRVEMRRLLFNVGKDGQNGEGN